MTKAKDIMTPNPVTCQDSDTIRQAVDVMSRENVGVVPIVDRQNRCCGIVTDRDICLDVVLSELDPNTVKLSKVMHTHLLTCSPEDDLDQVIDLMKGRQVKRILVIDGNGNVSGIISEADIAKQQGKQKVGELAEGVYQ